MTTRFTQQVCTTDDHLEKCKENLNFLATLQRDHPDSFFDWKITSAFYSALHLMVHILLITEEERNPSSFDPSDAIHSYRSHIRMKTYFTPEDERNEEYDDSRIPPPLEDWKWSNIYQTDYTELEQLSKKSRYINYNENEGIPRTPLRFKFQFNMSKEDFLSALDYLDVILSEFNDLYNSPPIPPIQLSDPSLPSSDFEDYTSFE